MNKLFFLNLLFLGSGSLNLLALTPEQLTDEALKRESNNLAITLGIYNDIKNANLSCNCREQLFNSIKDLPLSDVFKPRLHDCVKPSQESRSISSEELNDLQTIDRNSDHFKNTVTQYLENINSDPNVDVKCKDLLIKALDRDLLIKAVPELAA